MRTLSVVGARPQFIKIAPVCRAIERFNEAGESRIEDVIVHTGQHYDDAMSAVFFDELRIPRPAINLHIGSGTHAEQTGRMLIGLEKVIQETRADVVIVYGDTNSTIAGALAAAKLRVTVAHVEAGLRSFNRNMPEEINRAVADEISDVLYGPTRTAMENLEREGLGAKSVLSGDVMYDAVAFNRRLVEGSAVLERLGLQAKEYGLVTIHRAENTTEDVLLPLMTLLSQLAEDYRPIVLPMHPRTRSVLQACGDWKPGKRLHVVEPVGYLENLYLIEHARLVMTDSGGMQKEAFFLNAPCITLRNETEWTETVTGGGNRVVGVGQANVLAAVDEWEKRLASGSPDFSGEARRHFGGGDASDVIVRHLASFWAARLAAPAAKKG